MRTYWVDPPSSNSDDKGEKGSYRVLLDSCYTTFTGGVVKDLPLGTSCFF